MFWVAHLGLGLLLGKLSGSYVPAILGSLIIDLDHLPIYFKRGILFNPKKLWKAMTDSEDKLGSPRAFLHNFFVWAIISMVIMWFFPETGFVFSLAYLGHLFLDVVDSSDVYPFYPFDINLKGPIAYLSKGELCFTLLLFLAAYFV